MKKMMINMDYSCSYILVSRAAVPRALLGHPLLRRLCLRLPGLRLLLELLQLLVEDRVLLLVRALPIGEVLLVLPQLLRREGRHLLRRVILRRLLLRDLLLLLRGRQALRGANLLERLLLLHLLDADVLLQSHDGHLHLLRRGDSGSRHRRGRRRRGLWLLLLLLLQ